MEVWVGMELPRYEVRDFSWGGGANKGQARYVGVRGGRLAVWGDRLLLLLADNKGEGEDELVVATQFEEEVGCAVRING